MNWTWWLLGFGSGLMATILFAVLFWAIFRRQRPAELPCRRTPDDR